MGYWPHNGKYPNFGVNDVNIAIDVETVMSQ